MPIAPIWKDRTVQLSPSAAYTDYEIRIGSAAGSLLFSGRAYRRPGEAGTRARINDVCADYLASITPAPGQESLQVSETFATVVGGVAVDVVTFVCDWSYNPDFDAATMDLAEPVTGELDNAQWLLFSVTSGAKEVPVRLTYRNGTTATVQAPVAMAADFGNVFFDGNYVTTADPLRSGTAVLNLSAYPGLASVQAGNTRWTVRDCGPARYAVYYVNAYGGWDSLLLDGIPNRSDALTRHTALVDYDNSYSAARGRKDYAIEVVPEWTLRTGLLTDGQSARMHHLLNSPRVFLFDIASGDFRPVVLTDTADGHLDRKGNDRAPVSYTFNAQLAQERFRR